MVKNRNFSIVWPFPITELLRCSRNDDVGGLYQQDELKIDALLHIFRPLSRIRVFLCWK